MPSRYDEVIRSIGLAQGIISPAQGEQAWRKLIEREAKGQATNLGALLVELRVVTTTDEMALVNASRYRVHRDIDKHIGELLSEHGYCSAEAVTNAMAKQKNHYRETGETLRLTRVLGAQNIISEAQQRGAEKLYELGAARR